MNFLHPRLVLILFGFSALLNSQAQESFNLDDAVNYALQNAWDLKTNDLDIRDAEEQIREYRAIGLPQIDGNLDYQRFIELPTSIIPAGSFGPNNPEEDLPVQFGVNNNINAGVQLNTMLLDGSYFIGLKAIRQYRDLTQKERRLTEFELRYAVRDAFYSVLLAKKARTVLEANIENLEKSLEETRAFYENGFLEKLDVDRLELSLRNLRTELKNQDRMIQLAKNALKFRINYSQDKEITLEGDLYDYVEDESLVSDLKGISPTPERRPEFKLLQANLTLQSLDIKQNKYRRFPKIFGFASYTEQLQGNRISDSQWFPNSLVGFNLSVPIFSAW
ncbi:MAG TPA: TolC family protein, partial [Saprospiraceae bacterium]|nr:TolC family protein [Saprospiraceae bacterium]